jgi:hypothetical protein
LDPYPFSQYRLGSRVISMDLQHCFIVGGAISF